MIKNNKKIFIIGLALFSMFFGAGNTIFPPYLGYISGDKYILSIISFIITGVGLPMIFLIATLKNGGSFKRLLSFLDNRIANIIIIITFMAIGPIIAIPRTAAVTYELGISVFFPYISELWGVIIFFAINLIFLFRKNKIVDNIGKILTPLLLISLFILIFKSIFSGVIPINKIDNNLFSYSFLEGYQTLDALAALVFAGIIYNEGKKYSLSENELVSTTIKSSIIAIIGLSIVYFGLAYVGAISSKIITGNISRTELLTRIAEYLLGPIGLLILAVIVSLACLTTSIGLIASGAEYFSELTNKKISYNTFVIIITIISIIIAQAGVSSIISIAVPILFIMYPILIVIVFSSFIKDKLRNNIPIKVSLLFTLIISIISVIPKYNEIISFLPLYNIGLAWIIPAIISFVISIIFIK